MANGEPVIYLHWSVPDADPIKDLAKSRTLDMGTVLTAPLGVSQALPQVATVNPVQPDQG